MPPELPTGLAKLLTALLKHQAKRWLDEDVADAIGDIAGEKVQQRLDAWLNERATRDQLLRAAERADEYFVERCPDERVKGAFTLRFWNLPSVQEALAGLPKAMDDAAVRDALKRALDADFGSTLTEEQRAGAADLYAEALLRSVGLLKDFALPVIVQTLFDMRRDTRAEHADQTQKLDKILRILRQRGIPTAPPSPTLPGDLPRGSYLPISPNPHFTGREDELETLYKTLVAEDRSMVINQRALVGMGGIGKTQLAVEFAWRYGYRFVGVHWVHANKLKEGGAAPAPTEEIKKQIEASIAECGRVMGLPNWPKDDTAQQAARTVRAWHESGPRLVILDNLEDLRAAAEWLARLRHSNIRILVTSRQSDWPPACGLEPLPLKVFTEDESLAFLRRALPPERATDDELRALHERLGGLPLALDLAAAYLKRVAGVTVAEYVRQLRLDHPSLRNWRKRYPNATQHDKDVAATFALSLGQVEDEAARRLFLLAGYHIPNEPLRKDVLQAAGLDDAEYADAVDLLQSLSLLQAGPSIHPLLAEFARLLDEGGDALFAWSRALAWQCYPAREGETAGVYRDPTLVPLARYALEDMKRAAGLRRDAGGSNLRFHLAFLLRHFGDLDGAMRLYQELLQIDEGLGDLQGKAATLHEMAGIYATRGDLDGAMRLYQESLQIKEGLGDLQGKAATLHAMAGIYATRGDLDGAMRRYQESLQIKEGLGDLRGKAATLHAMAYILRVRGDLDGAMRLYQEAHEILEGLGDLQGKAATLHEMAYILRVRGDLDGAMRRYQESLQIDEGLGDLRGKAATLAMLAQVLIARGEGEEALKALLASLQTLTQIGAAPDAQTVVGILADWRKAAGAERFDLLWREVTGEPVPDWLAGAEG